MISVEYYFSRAFCRPGLFWFLAMLAVVVGIVAAGVIVNESARKAATLSTAESICSAVSGSPFVAAYPVANRSVRQDTTFQQEVVKALVNSGKLDGKATKRGILDAWGNVFVFDDLVDPDGNRVFSAISPGPDHNLGSPDDLTCTVVVAAASGDIQKPRGAPETNPKP